MRRTGAQNERRWRVAEGNGIRQETHSWTPYGLDFDPRIPVVEAVFISRFFALALASCWKTPSHDDDDRTRRKEQQGHRQYPKR